MNMRRERGKLIREAQFLRRHRFPDMAALIDLAVSQLDDFLFKCPSQAKSSPAANDSCQFCNLFKDAKCTRKDLQALLDRRL